jgi:hypothetical protein
MNTEWILHGAGDRVLRLTVPSSGGRHVQTASPVLTVGDVCRRLRKSQRQVYRYLRAGRLVPRVRVLGQWLFAPTDVEQCARRGVPGALRPFFWDVRLADLSLDQHRDFILARLLEWGDRAAVRWMLRQYPRKAVADFLLGRGAELLSKRAWHFWTTQLGVRTRRGTPSSWRSRGRRWGGLR